jgi:CBS domain-containing protein
MSSLDLARRNVVTCRPTTTVADVADLMATEGVGSVVVTDQEGHPVGMVTDRDLVVRALAAGLDPNDLAAEDVMTADPETVRSDNGVFELTQKFSAAGVRRLPLVDSNGLLVGIVSIDDVMLLLTQELDNLATVVGAEATLP